MHCLQPEQAFIDKMLPSQSTLGQYRTLATLSSLEQRLHWSTTTRNDVEELRKVVMSEMVAIKMLLGD